jgi:hypothetical protein
MNEQNKCQGLYLYKSNIGMDYNFLECLDLIKKDNIVFEKQHIIKKELCLFLIYKRKYFQNKLDEFWIKYIYLLFIKKHTEM